MSYELSFSPEFFFAEGEPYDALSDLDRPCSVWAAIEAMRLNRPEEWHALAVEVFDLPGVYLTAESVLDKIRETDSCSNLNSPVEVWIDSEGYHTVLVYDTPQTPDNR